jgi:hypothetical protein
MSDGLSKKGATFEIQIDRALLQAHFVLVPFSEKKITTSACSNIVFEILPHVGIFFANFHVEHQMGVEK